MTVHCNVYPNTKFKCSQSIKVVLCPRIHQTFNTSRRCVWRVQNRWPVELNITWVVFYEYPSIYGKINSSVRVIKRQKVENDYHVLTPLTADSVLRINLFIHLWAFIVLRHKLWLFELHNLTSGKLVCCGYLNRWYS